MKLLNRLFDWLQMRCPHDDDNVISDIMEGAFAPTKGPGTEIKWCSRCGAYRICWGDNLWTTLAQHATEWRVPRASWAKR